MRTTALLPLLAALLGACSLAPTAPARAVYDLGPAPAAAAAGGALAWRIADVTAPTWLSGDGIAYRLNFQQAQRLERYRDSVWAAPPPALLTQRLRQQLAAQPGCEGRPAALLAVNLDEFEQQFGSATHSQAVLRVHATLWPAGGGAALQQHWRLERPAAPDAPGAARALAQAVDDWLPQLQAWLAASACR
ncbi:ABC-type transport auxiliary lipoprotein family protein [Roseateles sp. DXS20W]|uniref:ABC-type transport auxiliary lipoprotein family protein n=1 Tax=Pelomonas lactea TaxID=3299030 RepID=A0ABW7GJP9_9BURK